MTMEVLCSFSLEIPKQILTFVSSALITESKTLFFADSWVGSVKHMKHNAFSDMVWCGVVWYRVV